MEKIHRLALAFAALFALSAAPAFAVLGDVNDDGVLNNADVALVENHITGKTLLNSASQARADLNLNGQVDVGDVVAMAKMQLGNVRIVPNVIGEGYLRAEYLLMEAGLTTGQIHYLKSDMYQGSVVGQVPQSGLALSPGSVVDLYVSSGTSGGAFLEISPTEINLGTSGTQATFQVKCLNGSIPWTTGMWADHTASPASGTGDATIKLTLDRRRLPFGEGELVFAVTPNINSSASGAYASVKYKQTVYPPPTLDFINSWTPFSPGDTISISGSYFAQNAADNIISVNGKQVAASGVHFSPPTVRFTIPSDLGPGMVEMRARRKTDVTLGSSAWSVLPKITRLVDPTKITLTPGVDGGNLWVEQPWQSYTGNMSGYILVERSVGPSDWVLGGMNLSLVNGVNVNQIENPPIISGTSDMGMALEVQVDGKTYYLPARALSDNQLLVVPQKMQYDKAQFFAALTPGKALRARVWGSEKGTFYPRVSNWVDLSVSSSTPPIGSVIRMMANSLEILGIYDTVNPDTVVQVAKGTTLFIQQDIYNAMTLRAPGLWSGNLEFVSQNNTGRVARQVLLNTPGTYMITNLTNGNKRILKVMEGGAPRKWSSDASFARLQSQIYNVILPNKPVTLWANGATVYVPAGALPSSSSLKNLVNLDYRVEWEDSYTLDDPEAGDNKERTELFFRRADITGTANPSDWEPSQLLKPITIKQYYGEEQAINGAPKFAALDPESGIYWELPCTVNTSKRLITLVLPAGTYRDASPSPDADGKPVADIQLAGTAPAGFPTTSLYKITRKLGIPFIKSSRALMTDPKNRFVIDYITDSGSSSYVTEDYAGGIMDTLISAYVNLQSRGWRLPEGPTYIYLRKTLLGGYGSTTKAVFGRPTVTINIAKCTAGSVAYYTTPAHETGHVFQRNYTTNIIAKWFDEAAAEWIAHDTIGGGNFSQENLNDALPFIKTLPGGFTWGYSEAEGYAAAPWPIWLSKNNGECIRKVYEELDSSPLNWERHYSVIATACGKTIQRLYRDFAKDYWLQNFSPMDMIDLNTLLYGAGKSVALTMSVTGDISFSDTRPAMSSIRYSIQPSQECLDQFPGRQAVIRFQCNNSDAILSDLYVFGDRAGATGIPNQSTLVTTFYAPDRASYVVDNLAAYRTYRFIIANGASSNEFRPSIRIVFPTITGIGPSSGKNTGGYTVTVTGKGFGEEKGSISIAGSSVQINSWNDTTIKFLMPSVGDTVGSWDITVRTVEDVATNSKTFTFVK